MSAERIDFRQADFEALVACWRRFYPERYWIEESVLRRCTVESPLFDWGSSCIALERDKVVGFVAIKRSASRFYRCLDRDIVHINSLAFDTAEIGLDLMTHAKHVVAERGHSKLVFGQDSDHIFPGCPTDVRRVGSFLEVEGFVGDGQVHDLERDLKDYKNPAKPVKDAELRMLTPADAKGLDAFLNSTFPGRWRFDTAEKIAAEGIEACVFGLLIGGCVKGFAVIQSFGQKRPMNGSIWHLSLGPKWGGLGPIGVAADIRGHGYGNALLGGALTELKRRGVRSCIIDWTGLVEFYGKHGFVVTRTYDSLALPLDTV
ncbi:MAG TPA: GNAT family N-acetyltransferase [Fimbriimonadaceae bacterium]|nr:GNAT family N-acetyltransferase [Fimbriimonadaceae bacterium]